MNVDHDPQFILQLLRLYGADLTEAPLELLSVPLFPESIQTDKEILARKIASRFLAVLPEDLFLCTTQLLKYCIQKGVHSDVVQDGELERFLEENRGDGKGIWCKGPLPLVLTHDVDLNSCYQNIQKVAGVEKELGISSTWHFLTSGRYPLNGHVLKDLHEQGNEIGFHGRWHDIAIGFRKRQEIESFVRKGLEKLHEYNPVSFRAPALAWSPVLAKVVAENGFRADSSLKTYGNGWDMCRPIPLSDGTLWELPLSLQDDHLFKNLRLSDQDAGTFVVDVLARMERKRSPATLNFHPSIIASRLDWYRDLLVKIQDSGDWEIMTMKDCIGELDRKWGEVSV